MIDQHLSVETWTVSGIEEGRLEFLQEEGMGRWLFLRGDLEGDGMEVEGVRNI